MLPIRNEVSWSALIKGYTHNGKDHEALSCLEQMRAEGISPNAITFISILKACGNTGAINEGIKIHDEIETRRDLLEKNIVLGTVLVDMYVKCEIFSANSFAGFFLEVGLCILLIWRMEGSRSAQRASCPRCGLLVYINFRTYPIRARS